MHPGMILFDTPVADQSASGLLAQPTAVILADILTARVEMESGRKSHGPLPDGVCHDLRPSLPNAGQLALRLFMNHQVVGDYPLLFTTIALANPN